MSEQFEVGEVAWLIWSPEWPDHPVCECTIIGSRRLFRESYRRDGNLDWRSLFLLQYVVTCQDGSEWVATSDYLRKKRPPQDWQKICRLDEVPAESEGVAA